MNAPQESRLGWYARRLARMSPPEVGWRVRDKALQAAWARRQVHREQMARSVGSAGRAPVHRRPSGVHGRAGAPGGQSGRPGRR